MIINIPFELNEDVYIIKEETVLDKKVWIPPDYSLGGDVDGPFDRGHYLKTYKKELKIHKKKFHFGLLDNYNINEIYKNYDDAYWKLLTRIKEHSKEATYNAE